MCVSTGVVRVDRVRRSIFPNRVVQLALLKKGGSEIVMRVGVIGLKLDRLAQMADGFVEATLAREDVADVSMNERETQIVMCMCAGGANVERGLKMGERIVQFTAVHQQHPEVCVGNIIV